MWWRDDTGWEGVTRAWVNGRMRLGGWRLGQGRVRWHTGTECWGGHGNSGSRSCGSSRSGSSRNGRTTDSILAFALLYGQTACALPACLYTGTATTPPCSIALTARHVFLFGEIKSRLIISRRGLRIRY